MRTRRTTSATPPSEVTSRAWLLTFPDGTTRTVTARWKTVADGNYWFHDDRDYRGALIDFPQVNVRSCEQVPEPGN
jgi:hypothetical protein